MSEAPEIAEHLVQAIIGEAITPHNTDMIGAAANLVLVDCYDRRVLRDPFFEVVGIVSSLQSYMTRARIMQAIKEMIKTGEFSEAKIDEAYERLVKYAEIARKSLVKQMELIVQCPTKEDKVH